MNNTEIFLVSVLLIFIFPYILWCFSGKTNCIPLVVIQIVTGILFGPGILGSVFPETYTFIFNQENIKVLNGLSWWAIILFVWVSGIELDLHEAWQKRYETWFVSSLALLVPLLFGSIVTYVILGKNNWIGAGGNQWQVTLGIGMACSITALPILLLFLENLHILKTRFGQRIIRYASLDDIIIWAILTIILLDIERLIRQAGFIIIFISTVIVMRRLIVLVHRKERLFYGIIWLIICSFLADFFGLHYMVGAFLSGVVLDKNWFNEKELDKFRSIVLLVLMPFFFLSTGLRTSWSLDSYEVLIRAFFLLISSIFGKIFGIFIAGKILKWEKSEILIIGFLLQTKALIMIVFANILLDKSIITSSAFTSLLIMSVGSTVLTMPVVTSILSKICLVPIR